MSFYSRPIVKNIVFMRVKPKERWTTHVPQPVKNIKILSLLVTAFMNKREIMHVCLKRAAWLVWAVKLSPAQLWLTVGGGVYVTTQLPVHSGSLNVSFRLRKQLIKVLIILISLTDMRA